MQLRIDELEVEMSKDGFWDAVSAATAVTRQCEGLKSTVAILIDAQTRIDDIAELAAIADDEVSLIECVQEYDAISAIVTQLELTTFFAGQYDSGDAIVSIFAGAGGDDAQDWASMLLRMYLRWADNRGFATQIMARADGGEAGIKSVTLTVRGAYAYGYLHSEMGTHRLVRLSPFNSDNLRQTSFARVEVMPVIAHDSEIALNMNDVRIDTYRSSGAGGQSVNTTDSAVRVTHIPTSTVVTCQNERSQLQNKESALTILRGKLAMLQLKEQAAARVALRGDNVSAQWGSQIRSYVLHPYKMVKDHRTSYQTAQTTAVLDGDIDTFMTEYLRWK